MNDDDDLVLFTVCMIVLLVLSIAVPTGIVFGIAELIKHW